MAVAMAAAAAMAAAMAMAMAMAAAAPATLLASQTGAVLAGGGGGQVARRAAAVQVRRRQGEQRQGRQPQWITAISTLSESLARQRSTLLSRRRTAATAAARALA
jgi:hypothetical protein